MSAYDAVYRDFDAPVMRAVRREAYGEDVGQHSWVTAVDLRADLAHLRLTPSSRLLDLGCGPGGPLTFLLAASGCHGVGVERSQEALAVADGRARELGVRERLTLHAADLDEPLAFDEGAFDAVVAFDVVLHLRHRDRLFREVARVLRPGGRFVCTDAGIVTGALTADEVAARSTNGFVQLVPSGWNERLLTEAGLSVEHAEDRTAQAGRNAAGRHAAMLRHRGELAPMLGAAVFDAQLRYLEVVRALSERRALSRWAFLARRAA